MHEEVESKQHEGRSNDLPSSRGEERPQEPAPEKPVVPRWRPAAEPTCCGSGCAGCPF